MVYLHSFEPRKCARKTSYDKNIIQRISQRVKWNSGVRDMINSFDNICGMELHIMSMLERLVLKHLIQRTSQRVKRSSGAQTCVVITRHAS